MSASQISLLQFVMGAVVVLSSLWVLADTRSIGVGAGQSGALWNLGSAGWFWACLLLWFPSFFVYLALRPRFKRTQAVHQPTVAPAPQTPDPSAPVALPRSTAGRGMNGVQALVWGVLFIVAGLGLTGWGGWQSYADVSSWVQSREQLHEIEAMTPQKLAQARQDASESDNPFTQFAAGLLMTPDMMSALKIKAQSDMQAANANLLTDLPLFLLGLALVYRGNGLLGRARKSS